MLAFKEKYRPELAALKKSEETDILTRPDRGSRVMQYIRPWADKSRCVHLIQKFQDLWFDARGMLWEVSDADLTIDKNHFDKDLSTQAQKFVFDIHGFFAVADELVTENLAGYFERRIKLTELKLTYGTVRHQEGIHAHTYTLILQALSRNEEEYQKLLDSVEHIPTIKAKVQWAEKWMDDDLPLSVCIAAFMMVEAGFFQTSFAGLRYFTTIQKLPGITAYNDLIATDETFHWHLAAEILNEFDMRPSDKMLTEMMAECLSVEQDFWKYAVPDGMPGLTVENMCLYSEFVANDILKFNRVKPLTDLKLPDNLSYMRLSGVRKKTDFFQAKPTDYQVTVKRVKMFFYADQTIQNGGNSQKPDESADMETYSDEEEDDEEEEDEEPEPELRVITNPKKRALEE